MPSSKSGGHVGERGVVDLVSREDHLCPAPAQDVHQFPVVGRGRLPSVEEADDDVRVRYGEHGLFAHRHGVLDVADGVESSRVHEVDLHPLAHVPPAVYPVTGYAALGADDGSALPDEQVEEGRLARVGPAHYGYNRHYRYPRSLSRFGFFDQSLLTRTKSSRKTLHPRSRSISWRAWVPISRSILPRAPMTIAF